MKAIQELRSRTEALEKNGSIQVQGCAAKRARSEPRVHVGQHEMKPVVVLAGFPEKARKKDIEAFMKDQLKTREEWKDLVAFAPNIRSSIAMIKVESKDEVFDFIRKWKVDEHEYKDRKIRARADKPPEQRKANGKIYSMAEHLRSTFVQTDVDADFKNGSVWLGDHEVVKWDMDTESFSWLEDGVQKCGVVIDRTEAEKTCERV